MLSQCPQCSTKVECASDKNSTCWCSQYPNILEVTHSNCYCENCITQHLEKKTEEIVRQFKKGEISIEDFKSRQLPLKPLIEHLDYYMEGPYFVFKEWYHLKRGNCCGNGCRHCPYPKS